MQTELQIVCAVTKARCGVQYLSIINSIREELEHAIDKHSRELLCDYIELILDLCMRFL